MGKKIIKLPVVWEVCGLAEVEADSIEEAIEKFQENIDDIPLPKNAGYVDGSFGLVSTDLDIIKCYNE